MKRFLIPVFILVLLMQPCSHAGLDDNKSYGEAEIGIPHDIALRQAIDAKNIAIIHYLLVQCPSLANELLDNQWYPLVYALHYHGHDYEFVHTVIALLLESGASVDVWREDATGYRLAAIHYVAAYGYVDILQLLLKKNPNLFKTMGDNRGATALHYAAGRRLPNLESYKVSGRSWSPSSDRRAQVIMEDAVIKKMNYDHKVDLQLLPEEQHKKRLLLVRMLLEGGIDRYARDRSGRTALDYAEVHFTLIARLLKEWTDKGIEQIDLFNEVLKSV